MKRDSGDFEDPGMPTIRKEYSRIIVDLEIFWNAISGSACSGYNKYMGQDQFESTAAISPISLFAHIAVSLKIRKRTV